MPKGYLEALLIAPCTPGICHLHGTMAGRKIALAVGLATVLLLGSDLKL
jgi:hypothetical protein